MSEGFHGPEMLLEPLVDDLYAVVRDILDAEVGVLVLLGRDRLRPGEPVPVSFPSSLSGKAVHGGLPCAFEAVDMMGGGL